MPEKDEKLRVCILATSYPRHVNDHASVFVHGLAKSLVQKEIAVTALVPHEQGLAACDEFDGVHLQRFGYFWPQGLQQLAYGFGIPDNVRRKFWAKINLPFFIFWFWRAALKHAKDADVLHCHWEIAALVGIWVKRKLNIPVVYTVHRLIAKSPLMKKMTRYIFANVDQIHFNSEFTKAQAQPFLQPQCVTKIVYPSIDSEFFATGKNEGTFRGRFNIPKGSPVILGLGRMVEKKGFGYLLRAFNRLSALMPHLIFAGGGPLEGQLREEAAASRYAERIHFTGFIKPSEIRELLKETLIMVVPSIEDRFGEIETLGTVAMEAMAAGVVVVASEVGGLPDVVIDGKTGVLVPPKDVAKIAAALEKCLADAEFCEDLRQRARKFVRGKFSWSKAADDTVQAYREMLQS